MFNHVGHKLTAPHLTDYEKIHQLLPQPCFCWVYIRMKCLVTVRNYSDGTTLGANETLTADGIALGNAVKLRGYVDFVLGRVAEDNNNTETNTDSTNVSADVDFLIDFSPVTAEVHLNVSEDNNSGSVNDIAEQAFGRYSFNQDFHLTFGRQATVLGFDADEAPGLYAVTTAYSKGSFFLTLAKAMLMEFV